MTKDKERTPVAKDVITMCTKCGMELNHVVIAHNAKGIVQKVKCHTCGSEHKYRSDTKRVAKVTSKRNTTTQELDLTRTFETLAHKFKEKARLPYSLSGAFKNEDVIDHKTFGTGIVISASSDRMEVVFSDGPRILVCNRQTKV